jgi:class 3 adenylate cyclase
MSSFSIALAARINLMRKEITQKQLENERLEKEKMLQVQKVIEEKNAELEQKVIERTSELKEANEELNTTLQTVEIERAKSDKLLLNILPTEVASELKETGKTEVKYFESVTVLFADVKGFSALATKISPQALIAELDATFSKMDEISMRFGLERI